MRCGTFLLFAIASELSQTGLGRSDCIWLTCYFHLFQVVIADVGDKDSTYDDFLAVLPSSDCRYGGMTTRFSALAVA